MPLIKPFKLNSRNLIRESLKKEQTPCDLPVMTQRFLARTSFFLKKFFGMVKRDLFNKVLVRSKILILSLSNSTYSQEKRVFLSFNIPFFII